MTEQLRIVGVVSAEATAPFTTGMVTENYYDLPLLLNREVTKDERARIDRGWHLHQQALTEGNRMPLEVHGDRLILKQTTIEAVRDRVAASLVRVIRDVNAQTAEKGEVDARQELAVAHHRRHVDLIAQEIDWDA